MDLEIIEEHNSTCWEKKKKKKKKKPQKRDKERITNVTIISDEEYK